MLTKPHGNRTWASLFPNVNNPLEDRQIKKDWRLGIHFRPVNVPRPERALTLTMEIPGLQMENFSVEVEDQTLTIIAETNEFVSKDEGNYIQEEVIRHFYRRVYDLPEDVNNEQIDASFNHDVLTLILPKKKI